MSLFLLLSFIAYVVIGVIAYANDVFDDSYDENETGELTPALTFALIGGAVITLRVFHLASRVLLSEVNKAFPGLILFVIDTVEKVCNLVVDGVKAIWRGITYVGRGIKDELF